MDLRRDRLAEATREEPLTPPLLDLAPLLLRRTPRAAVAEDLRDDVDLLALRRHPPLSSSRLPRLGQGGRRYDEQGRRYFDAVSSWWVNLFGHADPRINAAIKDQLDTLPHVMLAGCTHEPAVQLAERLSALTGGVLGHCFFASDGASAVEIALKMSFHHWRNRGRPATQDFV